MQVSQTLFQFVCNGIIHEKRPALNETDELSTRQDLLYAPCSLLCRIRYVPYPGALHLGRVAATELLDRSKLNDHARMTDHRDGIGAFFLVVYADPERRAQSGSGELGAKALLRSG